MKRHIAFAASVALVGSLLLGGNSAVAQEKSIAYLTPSVNVQFWRYVATGAEAAAKEGGYTIKTLDSANDAKTQLQNAQDAIAQGVAGIVISPTDSSTAPSVLKLAENAGVPVVIADIGTNEGEYVSFVGSDNYAGAVGIGKETAKILKEKNWTDGSFGIIGIPQARINGQLRSKGFREAMAEVGMTNEIPLQQMQTFTAEESYRFAQDMITAYPDLRAIFVESDVQSIGAQQAVRAARKSEDMIIAAFDGTPELVEKIKKGDIIGSGMQQPYLMGFAATEALIKHIAGEKVEKEIALPVLIVTSSNINDLHDEMKLNVFAGDLK
ncbi:substrate-binding domain-containing protein [uncultured Cohaesibacter sp.]|uniref:substrate-binding domain-containing protein n=1 Tax=uncultured Cohaesibacter sp. TaxID=1002546 RepID=UPI0029C75443|nr:substrate-binding domain-containing protein [uncultured Cohaesibacter sp.]